MRSGRYSKYFVGLGLLSVVIIAGVLYFWRRSVSAAPNIRHIVLISIDTCRADYLSCYGYKRPTTPNIDAVAAEGILFGNAISPVPMTMPSHSSMLTGTIPPYHGVHANLDYQLAASNITLPEVLAERGFKTGAIVSAFVLDSQFGLDQGFHTYNDQFEDAHTAVDISERKAGEATRFALEWLEEQSGENFFLFLHYFDPHDDYVPPEPFASQFADDPYAGEIAYTDHCIGQVVAKLKDLGLYDSTLIIITSDHGEMLGEHGERTHAYFIYQSAIKVPLIFKLPGRHKPQRVNDLVGIIDIAPTIYGLLDIEVTKGVRGQDLSPYFRPNSPTGVERSLYCETIEPTGFGANSLLALVSNRFKYIQTTHPELYDLLKDPAESNNLIDEQQQQAKTMKAELAEILAQSARQDSADNRMEMDDQTRQRLGSLGYVSGKTSEGFEFDQSKKDPKDLIEFVTCYRDAVTLSHQEQYDQAIRDFDKAIELNPRYAKAYNDRGTCYLGKGDYDQALRDFDKAIALSPADDNAYNNRGLAYSEQGNYNQAIRDLNQAIELNPRDAKAYNNRGTCYLGKGDYDRAIRDFDQAIELNPRDAKAYNDRGTCYLGKGDYDRAISHYRQALRLRGDWPVVLNNLAWILATHEDTEIRDGAQAVRLAEQACQLEDSKVPTSLDTLAAAYAEIGQFERAVKTAERAVQLARNAGEEQLARDIQGRLQSYRAKRPYREQFSPERLSRPD